MPRTKGSKNRPKHTNNSVAKTDYASQIVEKPEFDAEKNLKEQMDAAVALYEEDCALQDIADALNLNPIKVRKLLITAGVYESETADKVQDSPEEFLDQFNTFSIYQILPQLIELWGLNVQTEVESRKNLAKVSGK